MLKCLDAAEWLANLQFFCLTLIENPQGFVIDFLTLYCNIEKLLKDLSMNLNRNFYFIFIFKCDNDIFTDYWVSLR